MNKFSAVVFDLDGTLLDTLEDLGDAVNRVLADRGFPAHPMDAYRYFVGDGSAVLIERALRNPSGVPMFIGIVWRRLWRITTRAGKSKPGCMTEFQKCWTA